MFNHVVGASQLTPTGVGSQQYCFDSFEGAGSLRVQLQSDQQSEFRFRSNENAVAKRACEDQIAAIPLRWQGQLR